MSSDWFDVDKAGLAAIAERRGKAFAVLELVQNSWDAGAEHTEVSLEAIVGEPYATLRVADDGSGFVDVEDARKMFKKSARADDPQKRGRFSLGEKLVLACCRTARIETTTGTIAFHEDSTVSRSSMNRTLAGTVFWAQIRMTRDELAECCRVAQTLIPPDGSETIFNCRRIAAPPCQAEFKAKLPTEFAIEGQLRRSRRATTVRIYPGDGSTEGMIYEMGIPIVETDNGWLVNIMQKVPLNFERDNVTPAFLKEINALLLNEIYSSLDAETATASWIGDALEDSRVSGHAVRGVVTKRFGERAVVSTPADPVANASAAANGCPVVPGGALSGPAWSNIKKYGALLPASKVFPSPPVKGIAASIAAEAAAPRCNACGQTLPRT